MQFIESQRVQHNLATEQQQFSTNRLAVSCQGDVASA